MSPLTDELSPVPEDEDLDDSELDSDETPDEEESDVVLPPAES